MTRYHNQIILDTLHVPQGTSIRLDCPSCHGTKTLSVTHSDTGILYHCFRASCDLRGAATPRGGTSPTPPTIVPKPVFDGEVVGLNEVQKTRIKELWGIVDPPQWYSTEWNGTRIAMSIRSPKFQHRGWLLRSIDGDIPKALTYTDEGQEGLSWYKTNPYAPTVLVEDIPSAVRASKYVNSVALLGTGIGLDRALEIAQYATRPIVLALDKDATVLSIRWARKHSLLWGDVKVLPLEKDLKNLTEEELKEILR